MDGLKLLPGYLSGDTQRSFLEEIVAILRSAPLYTPVMPRSGKPFSVRMSNCGPLGWVSDRTGYRYQPNHPETGMPWPAMPETLSSIWRDIADYPHPPEACLINYYAPSARMGLHVDADEADFSAPVMSLSLGATGLFRIGGRTRKDPTRSLRLSSGDVVVLGGKARKAFHGIDRIISDSSGLLDTHRDLFPEGGRINLTLRRVTLPSLS